MKKVIIISSLFFLSFTTYANNLKIGIVSVPTLLDRAPQVAHTTTIISQEFKPKENEILALRQELKATAEKYARNKSIMSAEKAREVEREITTMQKAIQRRHSDIQEEINIRRNQELQIIQDLINDAIQQIGIQEKYDLILYEGIAYNNDTADVTPLVLDYLESVYNQPEPAQ